MEIVGQVVVQEAEEGIVPVAEEGQVLWWFRFRMSSIA